MFAPDLRFSYYSEDCWLPYRPFLLGRKAGWVGWGWGWGRAGSPEGGHICWPWLGADLLCPFTGTSSSALPPTWAVSALPTLTLLLRFPSRAPSSSSGPARNGPSSVSPMCLSCVPARNHRSRSRDGKAVAGFSAYFSSCNGLHLPAKTAGGCRVGGRGLSF